MIATVDIEVTPEMVDAGREVYASGRRKESSLACSSR
jgi:hypothetical protein